MLVKNLTKIVKTKTVNTIICDICQNPKKPAYRLTCMYSHKFRRYAGSNMPVRHTVKTERCIDCLEKLIKIIENK